MSNPVPVCLGCPQCWGDGFLLTRRAYETCGPCSGLGRIGRCPQPLPPVSTGRSLEEIAKLVDAANMSQEWKDGIVWRFERLAEAFTAKA
jgi:hypothetical protein